MRAVSNISDYFVICSGPSTRRVQTISEGIEEELRSHGIKHYHIEGRREALWVLLDYGDVIAHVFYGTTRDFYDLERLWHDAPKECFFAPCESPKSKKT
jgi:ribosome-associated protein